MDAGCGAETAGSSKATSVIVRDEVAHCGVENVSREKSFATDAENRTEI